MVRVTKRKKDLLYLATGVGAGGVAGGAVVGASTAGVRVAEAKMGTLWRLVRASLTGKNFVGLFCCASGCLALCT